MKTGNQANLKKENHRQLIESVIVYAVFCSLSFFNRFVLPVFLLVVVSGLAFPLVWAKFTRSWTAIGFTRRNLEQALLWGLGTRLAVMLYVPVTSEKNELYRPCLNYN